MAVTFPGESKAYRKKRRELLKEEVALRRHVEKVAALRRKLPLGGPAPKDYLFEEGSPKIEEVGPVRSVRLSQLFAPGKDTLVLYSYMYGPAMKNACPSCTSLIDGFDGTAPHVSQRVNFAIEAKSPIERIRMLARGRGWRHLRLLSSAKSTYRRDYLGEGENGQQNPMLNVFVRRKGKIHHFWGSEMLFSKSDKKADGRHVDMFWPLWNLFDLTPEGRGTDWYPRLSYTE
jgi:predicted dithiol-disulfide oxidoreductase (DUF899 family)